MGLKACPPVLENGLQHPAVPPQPGPSGGCRLPLCSVLPRSRGGGAQALGQGGQALPREGEGEPMSGKPLTEALLARRGEESDDHES